MLYTILLLTANFVGSLLLEMYMGPLAWIEIIVLILFGGLSIYIGNLLSHNDHRAWNILIAYHSLAIANLTFMFFVTGEWVWYIILLLANLIGLLRAVSFEDVRGHHRVVHSKVVHHKMADLKPHGSSQRSQVVDLPSKENEVSYNEPTGSVEPYSDDWTESPGMLDWENDTKSWEKPADTWETKNWEQKSWEQPRNLESYDAKVPVIEPDTLYTSPFENRIENGEARRDRAPELIVKLPTVAPKNRRARRSGRRAKRATSAKKARTVRVATRTVRRRAKKTPVRVVTTRKTAKRALAKSAKAPKTKAPKTKASQAKAPKTAKRGRRASTKNAVVKTVTVTKTTVKKTTPVKKAPAKKTKRGRKSSKASGAAKAPKATRVNAPTVRVVRKPTATVVAEGEPIAAEPGRRRLILDL